MSEMEVGECPIEELDAFARGELSTEEETAVQRHVDGCTSCTAELELLRAEQRQLAARLDDAPAPPPGAWDAIERRTSRRVTAKRRIGRIPWIMAGAALAAAAAVLVVGSHGGQGDRRRFSSSGAPDAATATVPGPGPDPAPAPDRPAARGQAALDDADQELDTAIAQLQTEYVRRRANLPPARARRYDEQFAAARAAVDDARKSVGTDVSARRHVLQARARYLRSMQAVVLREGS